MRAPRFIEAAATSLVIATAGCSSPQRTIDTGVDEEALLDECRGLVKASNQEIDGLLKVIEEDAETLAPGFKQPRSLLERDVNYCEQDKSHIPVAECLNRQRNRENPDADERTRQSRKWGNFFEPNFYNDLTLGQKLDNCLSDLPERQKTAEGIRAMRNKLAEKVKTIAQQRAFELNRLKGKTR